VVPSAPPAPIPPVFVAPAVVALVMTLPDEAFAVARVAPPPVPDVCGAVVVAAVKPAVVSVGCTGSDPPASDPHAQMNGTRTPSLHELRTPVVVARPLLAGNGSDQA